MVDYHRGQGYTPCDFDEFTQMIVARGGGHTFEKTPAGHVLRGDLIMVEMSRDHHDLRAADIKQRTAHKEGNAKNSVYQAGDKLGVDVYEGSATKNPRMENLLNHMEKELGVKGVRQAYFGS